MTTDEAKEVLKSLLPPGSTEWMDFEEGGDLDQLFEALAAEMVEDGTDKLDELDAEMCPATATAKLPDWEAALGLSESRIARYGTDVQRRAQIVAWLRARGTPTLANIRAVVAPLLGYADPADLEIVEQDRADLSSQLTVTNLTGCFISGGGSLTQTVVVPDQAVVSRAGAIVTFVNFVCSNDVKATLTAPDSTMQVLGQLGTDTPSLFPAPGPTAFLALWFRDLAGAQVGGTWTLKLESTADDIEHDGFYLLAEGIGRDGSTEGLARAMFLWAVVVNPLLEGAAGDSDRDAARSAVQRLAPAHTQGYLALRASDGTLCAIYDDSNALFDACLFC